MLRRVLKRANRMGFTFHGYDLDQLNETSQNKLFRHCRSERHCLRHLFTVKSRLPGAMHLRQRGHDSVLPNIKYDFNKRHFIALSLSLIMSKFYVGWLGNRVVSVLDSSAEGPRFKSQSRRCRVSLRQTVHTHCASVHQAAKLVAALLRVAGVTAGLAESGGSLSPGL